MPFTLQKWTDLIPRFHTCISLTKLSSWCSQALLTRAVGEPHTFHVSWNNKDKDFVIFLIILPYFLDFSNNFAISWSPICCAGELLGECRSGDFHWVLQLTSLQAHWFINSKWTHSFILFFLFGCTWFITDIFPSAFSNVSKLTPERFRIYENASSEHLLSRFLLCHINEDQT